MNTPNRLSDRMQVLSRAVLSAAFCGLLAAGAGCSTDWHSGSKSYLVPYENGDFKTAAAASLHCAHDGAPTDALLFNLDAGAILRTTGDIGQANSRLDDADALVGNYENWPTVSISEETTAALTNARATAYRGKMSDLVMLNVYRAINHMELGHNAGARSMLIKAGFVQSDIATKYEAELQKAEDDTTNEKKKDSDQFDTDKSVDATNKQTQDQYKDLLGIKAYANYVNPFCDYMQGIYFMAAALDGSDRERAVAAFKRAASMVPENPYIVQDIADANNFANGTRLPPLTYVIFETGVAPETDQVKITLPLFLTNKQVPTVSMNFPYMKVRGNALPELSVEAGGTPYTTKVVSDMDAVILQEFKNTLPTVTQRMIIAAGTKAAIDAGIRQGTKNQSSLVQGLYDATSVTYQAVTNQADLRSWRSLPKQFQIARFPTPADRKAVLSPGDMTGAVAITLENGPVNVVYVKSVRRGVRLVVRQFVIRSDEVRPIAVPAATLPATIMP